VKDICIEKVHPVLNTERLLLRMPEAGDVPAITQQAGVFEIADTTLKISHPYTPQDARNWIHDVGKQYRAGTLLQWVIFLREKNELVGAIGLSGIDREHRHAELGYWIGKPWWRSGFATEAARAVVQFAFSETGMHRIYAHHFSRNPGSGRVLQKIGMQYEGKLREHVVRWGRFEDIEIYGIINIE
jgi:RimJ/RimL family protein N-acetyltransferase